jgi:hypothetical protein
MKNSRQDGTDCGRSVPGKTANWLFDSCKLHSSLLQWQTTLNELTLLKKLTVSQHVRKFPVYYLIRKFVAVFTKAHHGLLFWTRPTDSKVSHPHFTKHFSIILPPTPRSSKAFPAFSFPSEWHHTRNIWATSVCCFWLSHFYHSYIYIRLKISACFLSKMSVYVIWSCPWARVNLNNT